MDIYTTLENHISTLVKASKENICVLENLIQPITVSAKDFLLQPNALMTHNYFVVSGCLKAYYMDSKGDIHVIQFAIENWWVSDFEAFYFDQPNKLYIEAIEKSTVLAISKSNLEELFNKAPVFERYFRILNTNAFIAQQKRILSSLEKNTKERYLEFCASYPNIENRVQNYHIANYLGVSAERLSRIRTSLKK